jgi:hypothetical protein
MDYGKIYTDLIQRGLDRTLPQDTYIERHHVWPKCMGGPDEESNIVKLTAEEHFLAHQLLVKMFPDNHKLVYACKAMSMNSNGRVNMKMYGWLKRKHSMVLSKTQKGKTLSEEHRRNLSESHMGYKHTDQQRIKISESLKGIKRGPFSEEHRSKLSEAHKGVKRKPLSNETKRKIGEANKGKTREPRSEETRRKMSEAIKQNWAKRKAEKLNTTI